VSLIFAGGICPGAETPVPTPNANPGRATWFRDAKFGMFIHWGLYAQTGGEWQGRKYFGIGEWLMNRAKIPSAEYATLAGQFNPTNFNAHEWVSLARAAGMKYIVITSKHHDGFAMFKSAASPFNIVDATPFQRDPMKELAVECRKQGIPLCFYYSQWQDWHEPGGAGNDWEFPDFKSHFGEYFETKCKPQIKELLSNYGPLGLIWFDTPGEMTREQSDELLHLVRQLQPGCLVSSRVGNGVGDFTDLKDHEMPSVVPAGPWESLFTHNDSWGFVPYDKNWRSSRELVHMLVKINAKGGNLILNVGPQPDGRMPTASLKVLRQVGEWTQRNAEAVYGTTASPFPPLAWGECTVKPDALYFHVLEWPADRVLRIPGLRGNLGTLTLLTSGKTLTYRREGDDLLVALPVTAPDAQDTVLKLKHDGPVSVNPVRCLLPGLVNVFEPTTGEFKGKAAMNKQSWMQEFGNWKHEQRIEKWEQPIDAVEWPVRVASPGEYRVTLTYSRAGKSGRQGRIDLAGQTLFFEAQNTGTEPRHEFTHIVGVVNISQAGPARICLAPAEAGNELFSLREVRIESFDFPEPSESGQTPTGKVTAATKINP
jgi:alpha-L-fucosidase